MEREPAHADQNRRGSNREKCHLQPPPDKLDEPAAGKGPLISLYFRFSLGGPQVNL